MKTIETETGNKGTTTSYKLCRVCSDTAAIKARYPERMGKWFRLNQGFKGRLRKEDWLCKGCYGEWYGDNKEWLLQLQSDKDILNSEQQKEDEQIEETESSDTPKVPKKEYFIKVIIPLLVLVVKNLSSKAISHRKMLVRYIALGEIRFNQLPTALHYLRKLGNGIIDQEDFEKKCGIGIFLLSYLLIFKAVILIYLDFPPGIKNAQKEKFYILMNKKFLQEKRKKENKRKKRKEMPNCIFKNKKRLKKSRKNYNSN